MEKPQLNKKSLESCLLLLTLLIGLTYSSPYLVQFIMAKKGMSERTSDLSSKSASVSLNGSNAITLNALELKNETYRWQNASQAINPVLHLVAHKDYVINIKNPTDAKHELIIGSNGTEIAKSNGVNPSKNKNLIFNANSTGIFEYHCEYHPDTMKGIIEITPQ
jgi:plastocyanin